MTATTSATEITEPASASEVTAMEVTGLILAWFDAAAKNVIPSQAADLRSELSTEMLRVAIESDNNGQQFYHDANYFQVMEMMVKLGRLYDDHDLMKVYNAVFENVVLTDEVLDLLRQKIS